MNIMRRTTCTNKIMTACAALAMTVTAMQAETREVTVRVVCTSDVHGCFFPYDFIERQPAHGSMARVSTLVKQLRKEHGENLLLLDNGDILQGQPTCYFYNYVDTQQTNIAAQVLNYMGYDACSFGNHDIETGHAVYDKWASQLHCPVLGANIIRTETGRPYSTPYAIFERDGVRIAVLSMLTPAIPNWLNGNLWDGMRFDDIATSARQWVERIKNEEHPDAIIGLFHSGWDGGIVTDSYREDDTKRVAMEVEGFDLILFGHDHTARCQRVANARGDSVLCLDPSCNALTVADATLTFTIEDENVTRKTVTGCLRDVTSEPVDTAFTAHFAQAADSVRNYVERRIGRVDAPMASADCFFGSAPFVDLIHNIQLEATGADISFNAPLSMYARIDTGEVCVADMFKLYKYENKLCTMLMTGREIHQYLEMSYALWTNTMSTPEDHIMLLDTNSSSDKQRMGFKNFTFNFDSATGIDYEVDVTKPAGHKVTILQMSDGKPFSEEKTYTVALNSYRANGGGELLTKGAGFERDSLTGRIVSQSEHDQRHYIIEAIEKKGTVTPKANGNWQFVPVEWAEPAIERDRKLIFGE